MEKLWSKTEIAHLKRHASTQSVEELAQRFHTDAASVRSKLESLNLTAQDGPSAESDAAMKAFEEGIEKLYAQQWGEAQACFEQALNNADSAQLADRARQYIELCNAKQEDHSSDDPYLQAVFEKNRGNLDAALEICQQNADDESERFAYLMASVQAMAGEEDEAIRLLKDAIRLQPKNRVYAYHDPDFRNLQQREDFAEMLELEAASS